jgi:glycerophosphoryl diester phosphodiesterase
MIYAHRGGAALRPENTIASFDHGLSLGADGLELDVHLSRDGVVVVHHDATLERTTSATGRVSDLTAAELARVDAGYRFSPDDLRRTDVGLESGAPNPEPRTPNPESSVYPFRGKGWGVPSLREVLARYAVPLIIELKVNAPELARCAIDDIRAAGAVERVAFGSFGWRVLSAARKYEPRIPTGASKEEVRWALYRSWVRWPLGSPAYREFQVPERSGGTRIISRRFVAHAHRAGIPVKVWTVNQTDDILRLTAWGADAIISDRPDVAVAALAKATHLTE